MNSDNVVRIPTGIEPGLDPWKEGFHPWAANLDLKEYEEIVHSREMTRLCNIKHLGQVSLCYPSAVHSRYVHSLITLYWAREIGKSLELNNYNQRLLEVYALLHDVGHLAWGHTVENYLRKLNGFSHEEHALRVIKNLRKEIEKHVKLDDLVVMFKEENPLAELVSGETGADRLAYLNYDLSRAWTDKTKEVPPIRMDKLLGKYHFDGQKYLPKIEAVEEIVNLIRLRSLAYHQIYMEKNSEIAETMAEKLLYEVNIRDWRSLVGMDDGELEIMLMKHPNKEIRKAAGELILMGHLHVTAAVLKLKGFGWVDETKEVCSASCWSNYGPMIYRGLVSEERAKILNEKYSKFENIRKLEDKLMKDLNLKRFDFCICTTPQKSLHVKPVYLWDGYKRVDLLDYFPRLKEELVNRTKEHWAFRIAVMEKKQEKVRDYFIGHVNQRGQKLFDYAMKD